MSITHQPMLKMHREKKDSYEKSEEFRSYYQSSIVESMNAATLEEKWSEYESFDEQLMTREKLLRHEGPAESVPAQKARVMTPPAEPALSDKDRREKVRQAKKDLKRGQKLTSTATEFTAPILESEEERKKEQLPDHTDIPETELYAHVEKIQFNAYEFTPEYIGEHFQDVQKKIRDLSRLMEYCGSGTPGYDALTKDQKYRMDYLHQVYHAMLEAYSSALAANGLTEGTDGIEINPGADLAANKERNTGAVERLKDLLLAQEEREKQAMKRDADALFTPASLTKDQEQVQDEHREKVNGLITCRSERSYTDFETAMEIMSHLTSNKNDLVTAPEGVVKAPQIKELNFKYHVALARQVFQDLRNAIEGADLLASRYDEGMKRLPELDQQSKYAAVVREQGEELRSKYDVLARRKDMLMAALRHLADGDALPEDAALLLEQKYGYTDPALVDKRKDYASKTRRYNEITQDRRSAFAKAVNDTFPEDDPNEYVLGERQRMEMLMKTGGTPEDEEYNGAIIVLAKEINMLSAARSKSSEAAAKKEKLSEKDQADLDQLEDVVGKDVAEVLEPVYKKIMEFDTRTFRGMPDDTLAAMQEQLIELNLAGMMATDLGKHKVSSSDDTTVRDRLLGKPAPLDKNATEEQKKAHKEAMDQFARKSAVFSAKCTQIQAAMMKARAIVILKANKLGDLKKQDIMTQSEIDKNAGQLAPDGTEGEFCTAFAKKQYERGVALEKASVQRMLNDPDVQGYIERHTMEHREPALKGAVGALEGHMEEVAVRSQKLERGNNVAIKQLIEDKTQTIASLQEALDGGELADDVAVEIRGRIAELADDIRFMKIQSIIQCGPLHLVGDKKKFISEALFRAYGGFQQTDAALALKDDEYIHMLEQISAEAFLPENPTEDEVNAAKQTQRAGLKTYFDSLRVNYDHMEQLLGVDKAPDLIFLLEHRDVIDELGADTQVMCGMVASAYANEATRDLVDERLLHQAEYFNMLVGAGTMFKGRLQDAKARKQQVDTEAYQQDVDRILSVVEEHRKYLLDHPLKKDAG